MPTAEARVSTPRAERYLAQLCEHLGRMQHDGGGTSGPDGPGEHVGPPPVRRLDRTEDHARVQFDWGSFEFEASPGELVVRVRSDDAHALTRGQELLQQRIETIGRRDELTVSWSVVAG